MELHTINVSLDTKGLIKTKDELQAEMAQQMQEMQMAQASQVAGDMAVKSSPEMAKQGIHMTTVFHPNMSHNKEDITITANAIEKTLKVIEKAMNSNFEDFLEAPILTEPFRRLVR